jgi:predicted neuraminidase
MPSRMLRFGTVLLWGISLPAAAAWADDPALAPPPVIVDPGPEYADSVRRFQGIPGIERASNGRLWAGWYGGGTGEGEENYVMLVTSGDDGQSWSSLRLVIDPPGPVRAYDPCLWHDPQGRLWVFWAQSYQWWDGRSGTWAITCDNSGDEHPSWSAPRRLCDGIMMNKPTVVDGKWLLPVAIWERPARVSGEGTRYAHDLESLRGGNVVVSRDEGQTFNLLGQTRVPERVFDEHMLVHRRDGSLWMLVRTSYGIGESVSTDGGRTWTAGQPSGIPHVNSRFFIRRLASGQLLLVTHRPPDGKTRSHLTAHLSDDDGRTWTGGLLIDERSGVSYPDGVESPDGTIYLIYDYQRTRDKQILMATFTAADVAAGRGVSGRLRQRVVVNQASGPRQGG